MLPRLIIDAFYQSYIMFHNHLGERVSSCYMQTRTFAHGDLSDIDEFILKAKMENIILFTDLLENNNIVSNGMVSPELFTAAELVDDVAVDNDYLTDKNKGIILKGAQMTRKLFNIPLDGPVKDPIKQLRSFLALNMLFIELPKDVNGISFMPLEKKNERFVIFIDSNDTYIKQCFTAVHELGHIVFPYNGKEENIFFYEQVAHCFANMFLLPPEDVTRIFADFTMKDYDKWIPVFQKVSEEYYVSYKTIAYALYHAGMITIADAKETMPRLFEEYGLGKAARMDSGIKENTFFDEKLINLIDENILSEAKVRELTYDTMQIR